MLLTSGNSAKIYCLKWLDKYIADHPGPIRILDLGCGESQNFVSLLGKYADRVNYIGVEPDVKACQLARENLRGLPATIIHSYAYKLDRQVEGLFDIVISFSALEHVYRRVSFLQTAKDYLSEDGFFLINYDAGHFFSGHERLKNIIGPILAPLGLEKYYQSFVKEEEFKRLIKFVGLEIIDQKFFNTKLKDVAKIIPPDQREDFVARWLECELWLNDLSIKYTDNLASIFETRNFILQRKK
jgi:SAM-dependent methyltransferase